MSTPVSRTLKLRKPAVPVQPDTAASPRSPKTPPVPVAAGPETATALSARLARAKAAQLERQLALLQSTLDAKDALVADALALAARCAELAEAASLTGVPPAQAAAAAVELGRFASREAAKLSTRHADAPAAEWRVAHVACAGNPFLQAATKGGSGGGGGGGWDADETLSVASLSLGGGRALVEGARVVRLEESLLELAPLLSVLQQRLAAAKTAEGDALGDISAAVEAAAEAAGRELSWLAAVAPTRGYLFGREEAREPTRQAAGPRAAVAAGAGAGALGAPAGRARTTAPSAGAAPRRAPPPNRDMVF